MMPTDEHASTISGAHDVLIVGSGHAGAQAAISLRSRKFAGTMTIVGEEPELPYQRPPLSKDYLAGDLPFERILIRPPSFWPERGVTIHGSTRVVAVDPERKIVHVEDGRHLSYGTLIWAAGGHPRRLACPGHASRRVHAVRNRADVAKLMQELPATSHVCVVGGGYIGLEAAAMLTKLGKRVTLVETQDRVLARVTGVAISRFLEAEHHGRGVRILTSTSVASIVERHGDACGVRLVDGRTIDCDMVVVGIGIVPAVQPLLAAGADGGNGVDVDDTCRTSLVDVFAIGDCARRASAFAEGAAVRIESVQNANDMAAVAAAAITGDPAPSAATPWFWSHQFDLKVQTIGLNHGYDQEVVRGSPESRSFSVVYLKAGRVVALDCVNCVPDYVQGRSLVEMRAQLAPERIADATLPLRSLAAMSTS